MHFLLDFFGTTTRWKHFHKNRMDSPSINLGRPTLADQRHLYKMSKYWAALVGIHRHQMSGFPRFADVVPTSGKNLIDVNNNRPQYKRTRNRKFNCDLNAVY